MRFFATLILTILLSFIAGLYLPWWSIAVVAFLIILLIPSRPGLAFVSGFTAIFLLWGGLAWWITIENKNILAARIGPLLGTGNNPVLLVGITAVIGALVAGLAAMSAGFLRDKKKVTTY